MSAEYGWQSIFCKDTLTNSTKIFIYTLFFFYFSHKGMQVEGIYRINGNQADISLIEQKVEESE